jgi:hypothetical protein
MSLRRAPRLRWQRLSDGVRAQRVAGAEQFYNAAPIPLRSRSAGEAGSGAVAYDLSEVDFYNDDIYDLLTDGAQDVALTYLPTDGSLHVQLNGVTLDKRTDWTLTGQTLTIEAAAGALTDDVLITEYAYLTGMSVAPEEFVSDYYEAVLADSPLVYYRMDGSGATEQDATPHNRDGTLIGDYVRSRPGLLTSDSDTCTDFGDGSQRVGGISSPGSYVSCPYDAGLITSDFTFECWTSKGTSAYTTMMQQDNRIAIRLGGTGAVIVEFWNGSSFATVAASAGGIITGSDYANKWHLVTVFDSTANTVTYYVNGAQYDIDTGVTTNPPSASTGLKFGWIDGSSGLPDLDEVAWYGTALSADRVAAHWDAR